MNIAHHVERGRQQFPDRPALLFEGQSFTYSDLDLLANRMANVLRNLGIAPGDRVALFLPNLPAFIIAYLGIQKLGAIAVSVNAALQADEVKFILHDSGARLLVTTATLCEHVRVDELPHLEHILIAEGAANAGRALDTLLANASPDAQACDLACDAPAAIVYTSGTMGFPKGATLSHGNVISNMQAKQRYLGIHPDDHLLLFLPLFHCFGQNAILNSNLYAGATLVLHRKFSVQEVLRSIDEDSVSMFFGVPTHYILLCDKASMADLKNIRYFFSAAASLPLEIEKRWQEKFGAIIYQGYGLSETSPFASYNHLHKHKAGSIGAPIEQVEMRIVDVETGQPVAPGAPGEIIIRGPNVMLGYWNRPQETANAIRDGWFHTGDIGRMDEEGYFYLVDRVKDMINVGGLKVYPAEVENVLYAHPAVAEAAVYGVPDAVLGEQVRAHLVLKPGETVTTEALIAFCRQRLATFKVPGQVELVAELPKNPTGKILKRVLRENHAHATAAAPEPAPSSTSADIDEIAHWLTMCLSSLLALDVDAIDSSKPFAEYGLTSVLAVKLAQALAQWLGRPVAATVTWRFSTLQTLAHHLASGDEEALAAQLGVALSPPKLEVDLEKLSDEEAEALLVAELNRLNY